MEIKDRLKEVRKYKDLTQIELCQKLNITQQQYSKYERGINIMLVSMLEKVCLCLNVSSEYLLGFSNDIKEIKNFKDKDYYNDRIKNIREYRGLTQTDVARLSNITVQEYHKYEKGIRIMSVTNLTKICKCLNISPDYILGFINEMKPLDKNSRD